MHRVFGTKENVSYIDRQGTYLIPVKNERIGVVQTQKGYFLLGGGLKSGETDDIAIKRECIEEVGYTVSIINKVGSAEMYYKDSTIGYFHPLQTYYFGNLIEKIAELTEKDHKLVWLKYEELKGRMYLEIQNWAIDECWKRRVSSIIELIKPSKSIEEEIARYKQEHFTYGENQVHGSCGLGYYDDFDEWLNLVLSIEKSELRKGVHTSTFFSRRIEDGKLIGCIKIHHWLTEELRSGGHIAYGIRPSERNNGYGKQQLRLMLDFAKSLEMKGVIIACDKDNIASAMTAKSSGGVLVDEFVEDGILKQHYYIDLQKL